MVPPIDWSLVDNKYYNKRNTHTQWVSYSFVLAEEPGGINYNWQSAVPPGEAEGEYERERALGVLLCYSLGH
jgi:hypothetical protein